MTEWTSEELPRRVPGATQEAAVAVWQGLADDLPPRDYICGHCKRDVTSSRGYTATDHRALIYICHRCNCPSFFTADLQVPGEPGAGAIPRLPDGVKELWEEACQAMTVNAWTLVVLGCRKMLMNAAVEKGAKEAESFESYVDWLDENAWVPPGSKNQLDRIRQLGNRATHRIEVRQQSEAKAAMRFLELVLRFMFEFADSDENESD